MTDLDDPVPPQIHALEQALGVALVVHDIDPGPPATIVAVGMVDSDSTELIGRGATEDEAWRDLAVAVAGWRNVDPRTIRVLFGGA
jgi:hypothetical protein